MRRLLNLFFLFFLIIIYSVMLSIVSGRSVSFMVDPSLSGIGLLFELIGLIASIYLIFRFYKRYGFYNLLSFFIPLFLVGTFLEASYIANHSYTFHKLNFYFWGTPVAVVFYWSGMYLLYELYQHFGRGLVNRIKGLVTHLLIDVLITTPLAILFGFWTFKSTLLSTYPYIVPAIHLAEVFFALFYVLFQELLMSNERIKQTMKPALSLTVIFFFLLLYQWLSIYV